MNIEKLSHEAFSIDVVDDVLEKAVFVRLADFMQGPIWRYGHYSNLNHDRFSFWSASFFDHRHQKNGNNIPKIVCEVWELLSNGLLVNHTLERLYANAHTFGVEGGIHVDSKDEKCQSTILYCHPRWNTGWGGNLEIFSAAVDDVIKTVIPKPNRIVSFPGFLPHCAKPLARECPELRVSLVIKTRPKEMV